MPPSGYNLEQSNSINGFLRSCADALKKEGTEKQLAPIEALDAECGNIKTILLSENEELFARGILNLTYSFYSELLNQKPKTYHEFQVMVDNTLKKVKNEILGVHVPAI